MKFLLDTHIFLWWILDNPRLDESVRDLMMNTEHLFFLSAASSWEMAIKSQIGKLELPVPVIEFTQDQLAENNILPLDITNEHALSVFTLPFLHKDPFDRLLIAQAMMEEMILITNDPLIRLYDVHVF